VVPAVRLLGTELEGRNCAGPIWNLCEKPVHSTLEYGVGTCVILYAEALRVRLPAQYLCDAAPKSELRLEGSRNGEWGSDAEGIGECVSI